MISTGDGEHPGGGLAEKETVSMQKQQHILRYALPLLVVLALSACGPAPAAPAPTQTVSAIYTAAFYTFTAQQATMHATTPTSAPPSQTPAPSLAPTTGASGGGVVPITGATAAPGGVAGTQCNGSVYVNDATIPDGTIMPPRQSFTKTWTVKNTGTCNWTTAYQLVFITGEPMGGTSVRLPAAVPAGAQTQISVNLTSPAIAGNYTGSWQLEDAQGNRFGEIITVVIVVSGTGGTFVTATP